MTRIAIIGAGWAGLQSAALFCNKYGCEVVIYDEKSAVGGTWADNAAYTELRTHAPARTVQFIGFPYPKDLVPNSRYRIGQSTVEKYVRLYAEEAGLNDKLRLNTKVTCIDQINDDKVEISIKNKQTGEGTKETFDYVYNTGFGTEARKPPAYPGSDVFEGDVLTSHDIDEAAIEKMKQAGGTVVVLGGSKASIDMLVLLHKAGVPTQWIARRVYWFFDAYRAGYDERADKMAPYYRRLYTTIAQLSSAISLPMSIKMCNWNKTLVNPHPETADKNSFHHGSIDTDMLAIAKGVAFKQGEIGELTADGLVTITGHAMKCKTIIAAFGTDSVPLFPEFRRDGEVIDVVNTPHIYQMAMHPQLPRVYFTGPIPHKGFGMLNGYHSTQHSIILWSRKMSREELAKRTAREEKVVRKTLKSMGEFKPVFKRSISDIGNVVKYLSMVDMFYSKAGYTKPLNLGPAKFTWNSILHGKMNSVINRNPTKKEAMAALGTKQVVRGHGLGSAVPKASMVASVL